MVGHGAWPDPFPITRKAVSFINPFFLFALGAAALPVLFHFVRKMRAKKVPFGSLMFLKATPKELIKKRRLRDLLLLAVRTAMFALLALAFARPFISQEKLPFLPQQDDQSVVILIDNSYSMQVGDVFERARQEVLRRLDEARPGDEFALVAFSDDAQQLTPLGDDLTLHRTLARSLAPSNRPTDFYTPLRLAAEILRDARHDDRAVVLVSDFQQGGWTGALDNWKLDADVAFVPVKVAADAVDNAYVAAFNLTTKRAGSRVAVRYDARVAAQGRSAAQQQTVTLALDERPVERKTLPALASSRVTFQQAAAREGFYQGEIALPDDDLALDNRFFFTYPVAARPSILVVDEGPRGALGDAFFLRNAFDVGEQALYRFATGGRQRLTRGELRNHGVVFLANVGALSGAQAGAVRAYVEEGGSVVVSFGDAADLPAFSGTLGALGVGRLGGAVTARSVQALDAIVGEVDLRHPVFEVFAASGMGAILRPKFRRYARLVPDTNAVVVGTYDTGDPFLVERRLGRGKVLVYTSTFSTRWTDFPIHELYVPFVYQLVKYAFSASDVRHQYSVGEAVALRGRPGETWDVRAPGDRIFKVTLDEAGVGFFRETEVPGQYVAGQGSTRWPFSVNVDARESVLATRDAEEAYAAVAGTADDVATTPAAAALAVEDEEKKQKFWRYLILLVIGLFALETVLANRVFVKRKNVKYEGAGRSVRAD